MTTVFGTKESREFLLLFAVHLDVLDNPFCFVNSPIMQVFKYHKKGKQQTYYGIVNCKRRGGEKEMSKRILKPN